MGEPALDILREKALDLPENERARLARDLVASLDGTADRDTADEWEAEILRRLDQIDNGTAELVDREEMRRRVQARLAGT